MKQDILRLEIPVKNPPFVQYLKALQQIDQISQNLCFINLSPFFDLFLQRVAITVLIDEVMIIFGFEILKKADDVAAGSHLLEDVYFVHHALVNLGVGGDDVDRYDLDGIVGCIEEVVGIVNFAVAAVANAVLEDVVFYFPNHTKIEPCGLNRI